MKKILFRKSIAKKLERFLLNLHTKTYNLSGRLAVVVNDGIHPKHRIMRYAEWFLNNIHTDWVVLDVGCNTGMMAGILAQKARLVYGIEIDGKLIELAPSSKKIRAILKHIVEMAKELGITTVAEWVSTEKILKVVKLLNVDCAQGFLFEKPHPVQ